MSDSEDEGVERQVKIVIAGAPETGKTSIAQRYINNNFNKTYQPSVGVEFYLKRLVLGRERNVSIQLWDVAGNAIQGRMADKYLFGAHAVLLVYDVTRISSLESLQEWVLMVRKSSRSHERPPILALVANKADLEHSRQVKSEKHHRFAGDNGMSSFVVSAKTGEGVALTFQKIAAELLGTRLTKSEMEQQQPVVTAEIANVSEGPVPQAIGHPNSSSVCCVM